ncbi:hypothetical protein ACFQY5_02885 [Paeniroseomonas aquatica]|uniref:hypothetical protein n=1 Tax=Paeniroseomonas aquatica TaxID=373043 RepID=UPI0036211DB4
MPITVIRNADVLLAWDDATHQHVYMPNGDLAFEEGRILFVGRDYAGPADETISGTGMMVMPGLVNIHSTLVGAHEQGLHRRGRHAGPLQFLALRIPADLPPRPGRGA